MIIIKPTRWKHPSGYRKIQVKTETIDESCSDVIHLLLPDGSSIKMDSEKGEIRIFSNDYTFKLVEPVCSNALIRCEKRYND